MMCLLMINLSHMLLMTHVADDKRSDDSGVWPAGMGGRGFVKGPAQACVAATTACARGQVALSGLCGNCSSGQSSPDGAS
jgi:hypothetical protein